MVKKIKVKKTKNKPVNEITARPVESGDLKRVEMSLASISMIVTLYVIGSGSGFDFSRYTRITLIINKIITFGFWMIGLFIFNKLEKTKNIYSKLVLFLLIIYSISQIYISKAKLPLLPLLPLPNNSDNTYTDWKKAISDLLLDTIVNIYIIRTCGVYIYSYTNYYQRK